MLTREDVQSAYVLILGRPPESEQAVKYHLSTSADFERLCDNLLCSDEFINRMTTDESLRHVIFLALKQQEALDA